MNRAGHRLGLEEEAIEAIKHRLPQLDRKKVRAGFEQRFTSRRMAEAYVAHYQALARCA